MGINVDVHRPAGIFGMGVLQMVRRIMKALLTRAKVIIMDEPTSGLGEARWSN